MNIGYTIQVWQEGNQYIAHAMPLDIMSSSETVENAKKAVKEAVALFIATAKDMGTLEEALEECGYRIQGREIVSPPWIMIERQQTELVV
ncbi:MAG: hypothetical protein LRZ99_06035 [Desulfotomaculum sp.]|nr:hypothetical protein [Desulfotomaculum sp.]